MSVRPRDSDPVFECGLLHLGGQELYFTCRHRSDDAAFLFFWCLCFCFFFCIILYHHQSYTVSELGTERKLSEESNSQQITQTPLFFIYFLVRMIHATGGTVAFIT